MLSIKKRQPKSFLKRLTRKRKKKDQKRREQGRLGTGIGEEDPVISSGWGLAGEIVRN